MRQPYIGGQAVLEGVMMRSPKSFVVVVRRPDGKIAIREREWNTLWPSLKLLRWPFFRGAVVLLESLHNGFSALKFSADHAFPPEEGKASADPAKGTGAFSEGSSNVALFFATTMMVGLMIAAPHLLTYGLGLLFGGFDSSRPLFHLVDGFFRIAILLGYILLVSRTEQMKRVFQYHGAEHKAIWTYEANQPLTVENAARFGTQHPRCGTSFLFVVIFVSVLLHIALVPLVPRMAANDLVNTLLLILVKIPMAFPIAGVAYELQRLSARDNCPKVITWLTRPGMWMQNITTREPTQDQLEIALLSLARALAREEGRVTSAESVAIYPDFAGAAAV